jgi:hypothetical protein
MGSRRSWLGSVAFVLVVLVLAAPRPIEAHQQWGVISGEAAAPAVVQGNLQVQVARLSTGYYRLTFPAATQHILVTPQKRGSLGDASNTLASVVRDSINPRVFFVSVYAIGSGTPPDTTLLSRTNAWLSVAAQR